MRSALWGLSVWDDDPGIDVARLAGGDHTSHCCLTALEPKATEPMSHSAPRITLRPWSGLRVGPCVSPRSLVLSSELYRAEPWPGCISVVRGPSKLGASKHQYSPFIWSLPDLSHRVPGLASSYRPLETAFPDTPRNHPILSMHAPRGPPNRTSPTGDKHH